MLKLTAAALLALVSAPAMASDDALQQPDVTVAGYDCCEPACDFPAGGCCGAAGDCGSCCGAGGCGDNCCGGRDCCVATVEKVKVEKHCWCTETKKVCVPKVVCPWGEGGSGLTIFNFLHRSKNGGGSCGDACCGDACCDTGCCGGGCCDSGCGGNGCGCLKPRCGKVKCVKDLVKKTYECEECVCKWEVRRLPPCGDCCSTVDACCGCVE
ncbi:hypothetical protein [Posidoniimonas polymericola]|nr:hypothetical protein [Posidoniimonas polymericola]